MSFKIKLTKQAEKEFAKIDRKYQVAIAISFVELQQDPFIGKKLQGKYKGFLSHRVWPYRIIYEIQSKRLIVIIVRIGHRQGVYKK